MARARQRRTNNRYPGLAAAARDYGVSHGHARRVWLGERQSPELLKNLRARLKPMNVTPEAKA